MPDQAPGNEIAPACYRRWNWGAFLLPGLWPFWNGSPGLALLGLAAGVLMLVPFLNILVFFGGIALAIYLGIKGGEIAVQRRHFLSDDAYVATQRAWAIGGACAAVAYVVIAIVGVVAIVAAMSR